MCVYQFMPTGKINQITLSDFVMVFSFKYYNLPLLGGGMGNLDNYSLLLVFSMYSYILS